MRRYTVWLEKSKAQAQLFEGRLALTQVIFSIPFRASNHQILDKKSKTELSFLTAFISEFKFCTNPRLGYLNPALNNPAQKSKRVVIIEIYRSEV